MHQGQVKFLGLILVFMAAVGGYVYLTAPAAKPVVDDAAAVRSMGAVNATNVHLEQRGDVLTASGVAGPRVVTERTFLRAALSSESQEHQLTFASMDADFFLNDSGLLTSGVISLDMTSLRTDTAMLASRLQGSEGVNSQKYSTAQFTIQSIDWEGANGTMRGTLVWHGVQKELSFPIKKAGRQVTADFVVDAGPFGVTLPGMKNNAIRIKAQLETK